MRKPIKVKTLDMEYDRSNNLFKMKVRDTQKKDEVIFAIKGADWGIYPDIPDDILNQFCEDMRGKEKNLFIEIDSSSIKDVDRNKNGGISEEGVNEINSNLDQYPINEVMKNIQSQSQEERGNVG